VKTALVRSDRQESFELLDTGGLWSGDRWEQDIKLKISEALQGVRLILFCVDGRQGPQGMDFEVAEWLRGFQGEVLLVATKLDDPQHEENTEFFELYGLGFGAPFPTSAEHARGTYELLDEIIRRLPPAANEAQEETVRVAIIGRPNVGKSSLVNALIGDDRVIVADVPGTTRDSVDVHFRFAGRPFILVDTAGIRRTARRDVEYYARVRSERALNHSDVAVLVMEPFELGDHELRLANLALVAGKPVVLAINKWDLVSDEELIASKRHISQILSHLHFAPRVYTSALNDFGLHELLATVIRVYDRTRTRVPTSEANSWLEVWTQRQSPPNFHGKALKLFYITQAAIAPPTFIISVNNESFVTRAYEQYLRNRIREDLEFMEVPIRLVFKARGKRSGKRVRL